MNAEPMSVGGGSVGNGGGSVASGNVDNEHDDCAGQRGIQEPERAKEYAQNDGESNTLRWHNDDALWLRAR
jgi:hypothetical protein